MRARVVSGLLRALLAAVLLLAAIGCGGREPSLTRPPGTLRFVGNERALSLPARLPLPARPGQFTLHTDVALPEAMRGRVLSLVFPQATSRGRLRVGDDVLESTATSFFDRHRPAEFVNVYRIPPQLTARSTLLLTFEVDVTHGYGGVIARAPRLVAAPSGGEALLAVLAFNRAVVFGAIAVSLVFAVLSAIPLVSRRRTSGFPAPEAWFLVMCVGMIAWLLCRVGATQLLGRDDMWLVPVATTPIALVGTIGFLHAHFGVRRSPLAPIAVIVALAVAMAAIAPNEFRTSKLSTNLLNVQSILAIVYDFVILGRTFARVPARRFEAGVLFAAWTGIFAAYVAGNLVSGEARPTVQLVPVAWTIFMLAHAGLIARAHLRAQRDLNVELGHRLVLVEERNRDVAVLNEELRRQIGDRAGALADALSRLGAVRETRARIRANDAIAGRYRVVSALGAGGMGAVYAVERIADGKPFALKVLFGATHGPALARFAREAQVSARFDHPNLVGVVDVDVDPSGILFVVMELVKGETLAATGARFGDVGWAREILGRIAAGLRVLHEHGIVHRDLKPANVLLARGADGGSIVKIADFGISRLTTQPADGHPDEVSVDDPTFQDPALTRTGILMGTPAYMAPELARGAKDAQPSSDVWSFGVIAYELTTAHHPFPEPPIYAAARGADVSFPALPTTLPTWLAALIARCLSKDAAARPTAEELEAALAAGDGSPAARTADTLAS
ncbi:MAG: hypothetical protein NVSMB47_10580 [Polyangiales bacterium]